MTIVAKTGWPIIIGCPFHGTSQTSAKDHGNWRDCQQLGGHTSDVISLVWRMFLLIYCMFAILVSWLMCGLHASTCTIFIFGSCRDQQLCSLEFSSEAASSDPDTRCALLREQGPVAACRWVHRLPLLKVHGGYGTCWDTIDPTICSWRVINAGYDS